MWSLYLYILKPKFPADCPVKVYNKRIKMNIHISYPINLELNLFF